MFGSIKTASEKIFEHLNLESLSLIRKKIKKATYFFVKSKYDIGRAFPKSDVRVRRKPESAWNLLWNILADFT